MYGSIFYNFWAGLIVFTYYFFINLSDNALPLNLLLTSLLVAAVVFLLMFPLRALIAYIIDTKDVELKEQSENQTGKDTESGELNLGESTDNLPVENPDEIANVVRTMLNQEQPVSNNS